jgi:hypothetical protein
MHPMLRSCRAALAGALLSAACASAACAVARTVEFPQPRQEDLLFHRPFGEQPGYGGFGFEVLARAEVDADGRVDRSFRFAGGTVLVHDRRSLGLGRMPLEGGQVTPIAAEVPLGADIAGDAQGAYWVTPDCALQEAPGSVLGACTGTPRWLFVDATAVYLFAEVKRPPYDANVKLWRRFRSGGALHPLAALGGISDLRPDEKPLEDAESFYFTNLMHRVVRISKRTGASKVLLSLPSDSQGWLKLLLVAPEHFYFQTAGYLWRMPLEGGKPVPVMEALSDRLWSVGRRLYLEALEGLYAAPRQGGHFDFVAQLPTGDSRLFERSGKLYALDSQMLIRVYSVGHRRERQLLELDDITIHSLTGRGRELVFTRDGPTGAEVWALPKSGGDARRLLETPGLGAAPAFDDEFVYLLGADGALRRGGLAGGLLQTLVPARAPAAPLSPEDERPLPRLLGADATAVYWMDAAVGTVLKASKDGGTPTVLAEGLRNPTELELSKADVFVTSDAGLTRVAKDAGLAAPLVVEPQQRPVRVSVAGDQVWWTFGAALRWLPHHDGSPLQSRLTTFWGEAELRELHADQRGVVFTNDSDHFVTSQRFGHDEAHVLAAGHRNPTSLVVDDDTVYFVDAGERSTHPKAAHARYDCCSIWAAPRR